MQREDHQQTGYPALFGFIQDVVQANGSARSAAAGFDGVKRSCAMGLLEDLYPLMKLSTSLAFRAETLRKTLSSPLNRLLRDPADVSDELGLAQRCDATSPATSQTLNLRDSYLRFGYLKAIFLL